MKKKLKKRDHVGRQYFSDEEKIIFRGTLKSSLLKFILNALLKIQYSCNRIIFEIKDFSWRYKIPKIAVFSNGIFRPWNFCPVNKSSNIIIYVLYDREFKTSVRLFLEKMKEVGFVIYVINNNCFSVNDQIDISNLATLYLERENIGHDFGAYKDGFLGLLQMNVLSDARSLFFINDSVQLIPGHYLNNFVNKMVNFTKSNYKFFAPYINLQQGSHIQGFFLGFSQEIFFSKKFIKFWKSYQYSSIKDKIIKKGELYLSKIYFKIGYHANSLYSSQALYATLLKYQEDNNLFNKEINISEFLPQQPFPEFDVRRIWNTLFQQNSKLDLSDHESHISSRNKIENLHLLMRFVEQSNPTHFSAFLMVEFLQSPFLKKDLGIRGVFQVARLVFFYKKHLELSLPGDDKSALRNHLLVEWESILMTKGIPKNLLDSPFMKSLENPLISSLPLLKSIMVQ